MPDASDRRFLNWFLENTVPLGAALRQRYLLDQDYRPVALRLTMGTAPLGADLVVQVNVDGLSIFNTNAMVNAGHTRFIHRDSVQGIRLLRGQLITLDIASIPVGGNPGANLTVELELIPLGNQMLKAD